MPNPCADINKLIPTYLDGELAESELHAFEHHLADCVECATEVNEERAFIDRVRTALATPPAPDTLRARLGRALDAEDASSAKATRRQRFGWVLPGAATLTAAAAMFIFVLDMVQPMGRQVEAQNTNAAAPNTAMQAAPRSISAAPIRARDAARDAREFLRMPVRAPRFTAAEANLRGWEPIRNRNQKSALLVYEVKTADKTTYRLEVQTLDARNLDRSNAERRVVRGTEVWVATRFGVNGVSYTDENGVGYIFSSQMDMDALVDLVIRSVNQ